MTRIRPRGRRSLATRMLARGRSDVETVLARTPAAQSALEVALLDPGVHAVWAHRLSHALWENGARLSAQAVSQAARFATGIEIHPGATVGPRLFIGRGMGVVIGETTRIGSDVAISPGVTIGRAGLDPGNRQPTIGDRVYVGAGARILGNLVVGPDSRIGPNVVLLHSVEARSVVDGTCPHDDLASRHRTPNSPRNP